MAAGTFNTLAAALQAAGLADTLKGKGPFTVFAPTDEAFSKLPAGTVESLLKPENKDKLKAILLYHVVSGDVTATQVMKLSSAKTINGQDLKLTVNGGTVMVNDATAVKADVLASNGVAELAPLIAKRGEGAIVNLSTMVADYGAPGTSLYGSSKAALNLLTKTWAAE